MKTKIYSAINLAYQWEQAAAQAAREGIVYDQPLPLEAIMTYANRNLRELELKLAELKLPLPVALELGWLEVMVQLTKEHPGVKALAEAAKLEPSLEPLAQQLRELSRIYRECALEILARIEPKQRKQPAITKITPLKFDLADFDQEPPFQRERDARDASLFELMIKGFSLPEPHHPR
jgi:hypothetical protein